MDIRKESKGITLVALVVTIIILLILAAVTLSLVAGSEGILNKAANAVDITVIAEGKETAELLAVTYTSDYYQKKYVENESFGSNINCAGDYVGTNLKNSQKSRAYDIKTQDSEIRKVSVSKNSKILANGTILDSGFIVWEDVSSDEEENPGGTQELGYSIHYNSNVNDNSVSSLPIDNNKYDEGDTVIVSSAIPIRNGFEFLGWTTDSTSNDVEYTGQEEITVGTQDINLYAIWNQLKIGTLAEITMPEDYGKKVNYSITTSNSVTFDDWLMLYSDGTNVYLIIDGYLPVASIPSEVSGNTISTDAYSVYWNIYGYEVSPLLTNNSYWSDFASGVTADNEDTLAYGTSCYSWTNTPYQNAINAGVSEEIALKCYFPNKPTTGTTNGYWFFNNDITSLNFAYGSMPTASSKGDCTKQALSMGLRPVVKIPSSVTGSIGLNKVTIDSSFLN